MNSEVGTELHLRGVNARVVTPGTIRQGDTIRKIWAPTRRRGALAVLAAGVVFSFGGLFFRAADDIDAWQYLTSRPRSRSRRGPDRVVAEPPDLGGVARRLPGSTLLPACCSAR